MPNNNFNDVTLHAAALAELIEQEQYDDAVSVADKLAASIRQLSQSELMALSAEQQRYLYELAAWLTDEEGAMNKRSRQLIDVIAPFNKKSELKTNNKYQGKNTHG
ncbi:hypothetical protein HHX48_06365 [Salinimonas sp. HHU 13199]|uniref:Uncharacterized protein n=1 Tax=Salinimonas profundi TaxID=2729140 RepID=A0ABR8LMP7_9ALTE|nr:hypothetical protein [Salinimonas profundi]MBD3585349.1 hypothetical protein [Salinimonas profundi]